MALPYQPGFKKFALLFGLIFIFGGFPVVNWVSAWWLWTKTRHQINEFQQNDINDVDGRFRHCPKWFYKFMRFAIYLYMGWVVLQTLLVIFVLIASLM